MMDKDRDEFIKKLEELTQQHFPDLMNSMGDSLLPDEEFDDLDNTVVLTDEDGNDVVFEFLDCVEYNGNDYVVLLPAENIEGGEVVMMRIEGEGEDESYIGLDDDEEAAAVFNVFRKKAENDFKFLQWSDEDEQPCI